MSVVFHDTLETEDLPRDVSDIVRHLFDPLPQDVERKLDDMGYSAMTQSDKEELGQLLQNAEDEDTKQIADVLQLVLMSSLSIADVVAANFEGPLRPTTPIWFPLLRTVVRTAYQNAHATGPVPFVAPQGFGIENGSASMLLSYVADHKALFHDPDAVSAHSRDESGSSKSGAQKAGEASYAPARENNIVERNSANNWGYGQPYTGPPEDHPIYTADIDESESEFGYAPVMRPYYPFTDSASDKSVDSVEMLPEDLPRDAHILIDRGEWSYVTLPVICVADHDNIVPLLASVAHQRRFWGVDMPVVGLELSKYGSSVRVHVAWLDNNQDGAGLPAMHITRFFNTIDPGLPSEDCADGMFDIADAHSALLLARLLIHIGGQFRHLQDNVSGLCRHSYRWRPDIGVSDGTNWIDRIKTWVRHVDGSEDSSSTEASFPSTPSQATFEMAPQSTAATRVRPRAKKANSMPSHPDADEGQSAIRPPDAGKTKAATDMYGSDLRSSSAPESESTTKTFSTTSYGPPSGKSRWPSSDFAGRAPNYLHKSTINSWIVCRQVALIGSIPVPIDTPENALITRMVELYEDMFIFGWIAEWMSLADLPVVDSAVRRYREQFFEQYKTIRPNLESNPTKDKSANDPPKLRKEILDANLANVLIGGLSSLFAAADGAYSKNAGPANILEAESRHDWDALLYHFYTTTGTITSNNVLLERTLHFPANTLLERIDTKKPNGPNHLQLWNRVCTDQLAGVDSRNQEQVNLFLSAQREVLDLYASYTSFVNGDDFRLNMDVLMKAEPVTGKCDALLFTHPALADEQDLSAEDIETLKAFEFADIKAEWQVSPGEAEQSHTATGSSRPTRPTHSQSQRTQPRSTSSPSAPSAKRTQPLFIYPFNYTRPEHRMTQLAAENRQRFQILPSRLLSSEIVLPRMAVEYKKPLDGQQKALNQDRMYVVAGVKFLAALGIYEYPVYGLVTNGKIGHVIMAWMSSETKRTYIVERNAHKFDISNPLQAFQFAVFLLRLRARDHELDALFAAKKEELLAKLRNRSLPQWRMNTESDDSSSNSQPTKPKSLASVQEEDEAKAVADVAGAVGNMSLS